MTPGTLTLPRRPVPIISNGTLGTMLLVGTETVLFTCFISAYMVLRMSATAWPPAGTPALQVGLSAWNTAVLLISAITIFASGRWAQRHAAGAKVMLWATLGLGVLFIALQGFEFHALYGRGLTLQTGPYGAIFYTLVTCHALHVLGGLAFLGAALKRLDRTGFAELYWYFVAAVWLVLFSILYIL